MTNDELTARIESAIQTVNDPCSVGRGTPIGLVDMGLLVGVDVQPTIDGTHVDVRLRMTSPGCLYWAYFESEVRARISTIPDVTSLAIDWDDAFDWDPSFVAESVRHLVAINAVGPIPG